MEAEVPATSSNQVGVDQVPESTSPQPPKSPSKPPLLWFGIGLLVVVIGGEYYLLSNKSAPVIISPTPTPIANIVTSPSTEVTANWKTYTNSQFNFELKYPSNFEDKETKGNQTYVDIVGGEEEFRLVIDSDSQPSFASRLDQ